MIITVTLNPALDKTVYVDKLRPNDANRIQRIEVDAGGKGVNASRVLKELGSQTIALGFLGGNSGKFIEHVLNSEGVPTDFVIVEQETRTNISVQENTGAPPTVFNEPGPFVTEDKLNELLAKVSSTAQQSSMVIFGGSLPPGVPKDIYRTLIKLAHESGAKAILDSDGEPMKLGLEARPFMVKPNRDEVRRLLGIELHSPRDGIPAIEALMEQGVELAIISMGADGAIAGSKEGIWLAVPPAVKVVSTIGSGDSMVAGVAHILSQGGSLDEAMRWGTAAGAATAMTDGTEIGKREQVLSLLDKVKIEKLR
jgi:1-phosphofructokinase family hexose kinase